MKHSFVSSSSRPYYTRFVSRLLPQIHHFYTKSLKKKRRSHFPAKRKGKFPDFLYYPVYISFTFMRYLFSSGAAHASLAPNERCAIPASE